MFRCRKKNKRLNEVTRKGIIIMIILMLAISVVLYIFRFFLIGFFLVNGGPFFAIFSGVSGILNGSGHTMQQMVISLARLWALRLPLVHVFSFMLSWNYIGAWWGMVVSNIISALFALFLYEAGWWKKKIIEKPTSMK